VTPRAPIDIAFGRSRLRITAGAPDVHAVLWRDHRHLLAPSGVLPPVELTLEATGAGFHCTDSLGERAERPDARSAIRWARYRVLELVVAEHPELLWLHGGAVGVGAAAVLVIGRRGRGKSTLVTSLCATGASYFSDDILPIDPATRMVLPFPRAAEVRRDPGEEMPPEWLLEVEKDEVDVDDRVAPGPLPVRAVLLPRAGRDGGVSLTPCSAAEAVMAIGEGCWNFAEHGARAAATIGALASQVPVVRIAFDDGARAADAARAWLSGTGP